LNATPAHARAILDSLVAVGESVRRNERAFDGFRRFLDENDGDHTVREIDNELHDVQQKAYNLLETIAAARLALRGRP
jgi:hypothetical protein